MRDPTQDEVIATRDFVNKGDPNDDTPIKDRWHEYTAKFTDGQLVEIVVAQDKAR